MRPIRTPEGYRQRRERLRLTPAQLAKRLNTPTATILARESGDALISEESALAIQMLGRLRTDKLRSNGSGWTRKDPQSHPFAKRVRQVLAHLQAGGLNASHISREIGCTIKTVQRDIAYLRKKGWTITYIDSEHCFTVDSEGDPI